MAFELHEQLRQDCLDLGRLSLCRLLLMNDCRYPWFILVPERAGVSEIYQLDDADRQLLMSDSCLLSEALCQAFDAHKLNVAALGNMVPQLHIHHVVRYRGDPAWPRPIWGEGSPLAYSAELAQDRAQLLEFKLRELRG